MRYILSMMFFLPSLVWGHGDEATDLESNSPPKFTFGASIDAANNSKGAVSANQLWRIQGALMGGHAVPVEEGSWLSHADLWAKYSLSPRWQIHTAFAAHDTKLDDIDLELETLQLSFKPTDKLQIHAGQMGTAITPSFEQPTVKFFETSLMADALFGRHVQGVGVRIQAQPRKGIEIGAEAWRGDFFPATKGNGAQDVYIKFAQQRKAWDLNAGAWSMQTKAVARGDDRYNNSGHSHGSSASTSTPADVRFTGDTKLNGIWADIGRNTASGAKAGVQYEVVQSRSKGELTDSSRKATYSNQYTSYALTPYYDYQKLQLSYRFERLDLKNTLVGSGAFLMAQEANLLNSRSPKRQTIQATWRIKPSLSAVVAYTRDETLSEQGTDRTSIGLQWSDTLYQR